VDEKWEDALEHFDRVIKRDPQFFKAWHNKSFALIELHRYEEAIACYDKALELNPKYAFAWAHRGFSLSGLGRHGEAIACYDKALELNPKYAITWNNKGVVLAWLGLYEEALECYDKALEINPEWEAARSNRNLALMLLGRVDDALKEREKLSSEKKEGIEKSPLPKKEKEERILEIDAQDAVISELKDKYKALLDAKKAYEKRLTDSLKPRDEPLNENFFVVLRRWNSYTPRMLTPTESNLGGGYFLHWKRQRHRRRSRVRFPRQFLQ
jgi:tetratricopeptide (TPR) repeat protein